MYATAMRLGHQPRPSRIFGVLRRASTYRNLLYLLLSLPLAWLYGYAFVHLANAAIGSLSFLALPALLLAGSWVLATFERALAHGLLGVTLTPMAPPVYGDATLWSRTKAHLRNPVTWKSLAYLAARVPFGLAATAVVVALPLVAGSLILAPATYLTSVALYNGTWNCGGPGSPLNPSICAPLRDVGISRQVEPVLLALSLLALVLGVGALVGALHALNGLAWAWGWFVRAMLGVSVKDLQLAEARAVATEARARAESAEQGRRQLILDASHELRTPVATIRAHIESLLLLEGERLPEQVRAYLSITQREAERLSALVDDLLMLARADADGLRLELLPVALGDVIEEVFRALEPLAERERQVTLVHHLAEDLPQAYVDRDRLAQVLLNLVRNAITYTPAGGIVALDLVAGTEPGTIEITVTDTGMGIPEEDLPHIFERFYRSDASRARHTGGFGLGLSIVRDLVQAMGGSVTAEAMPRSGSRFRVTLRAVTVAAER